MARQMVTKFGMSEDLGQLALEGEQGEVFLGGSWNRNEYSEEVASRIDAAVREIVQKCYEDTCNIIRENRDVIDRVVDLLIEKESIDGDEFRQIVSEYTAVPDKERFVPQL